MVENSEAVRLLIKYKLTPILHGIYILALVCRNFYSDASGFEEEGGR